MPDFLNLNELSRNELRDIVSHAINSKKGMRPTSIENAIKPLPLNGKIVAMIFDKPSTRTRVSFDVGIKQLGGQSLILSGADIHLGHGESISDTAKVLSRYVDLIIIRTFEENALYELAKNADVPIINGLTNLTHPCQSMADVMTFEELRGPITGKNVLWLGDGNNVCASTLHAAGQFGFNFTFSGPESLNPEPKYLEYAKSNNISVNIDLDPENAIKNADLIMTDTWSSMHDQKESNYEARQRQLMPFQVNEKLISKSKDDAIFMHCLPAYRGQEVTSDVIDGIKSVVFDQAENRLHIQKSILEWCILGKL